MTNIVRGSNELNGTKISLAPIDPARIRNAKRSYTTRRANLSVARNLLAGRRSPLAGDLVLARVAKIGQHQRIELPCGRRSRLYEGDEIIVCYGSRYAPDQFEAYVPKDLGPCNLVAAGGVAAHVTSKHARMKTATAIVPIGLLADQFGKPLNLAQWGLVRSAAKVKRPPILAVLGSSMNAGKTNCARQVVHGLKKLGVKVGATKVTGTGAGGDRWVMADAGADIVLDFTDAGVPSTFGLGNDAVLEIFDRLTGYLGDNDLDIIVLEVADGLLHGETADLVRSPEFKTACDGVVFAAGDALGASTGVHILRDWGLPAMAASGLFTSSQLAVREAEKLLEVPIIHTDELAGVDWLSLLTSKRLTPESGIPSKESCGGPDVWVPAFTPRRRFWSAAAPENALSTAAGAGK